MENENIVEPAAEGQDTDVIDRLLGGDSVLGDSSPQLTPEVDPEFVARKPEEGKCVNCGSDVRDGVCEACGWKKSLQYP